jgi:hypothetical protein
VIEVPAINDEVLIIDTDIRRLMQLVVAFRGTPYSVSAVESIRSVGTAARMAARDPDALVVRLDGRENVVEIRTLLESCPGTRLLFLVPEMPPSAAVARVVRSCGGAILAASESAIVVVATVVSLLTRERAEQSGSA